MKKVVFIFCCIIFLHKAFGQQVPLDIMIQNRFNEITLDADTSVFTGFRSINWLELKSYLAKTGNDITDSAFGLSKAPENYFLKNLMNNNWIQFGGQKNVIAIDPYVTVTGGIQNNDSGSLIQAVGGLRLQGVYNDRLSYSIGFTTGYRKYPGYINTLIQSNQDYLPGLGKGDLQGNNGYTNTQVTGNLTYRANKYLLVSAGYGKNFIGDGYRSLILSDNASNNPYVRLQASIWKITYNVLYNKLQNPRYQVDGDNQKKYSVMHYLGINFGKRFQLGLYDNITFLAKDSLSGERGFDVQYLNPLLFMRPVDFQIGSPDNAFMGFTLKYKLYKQGYIYGMLGLDDLNLTSSLDHKAQSYGNKYALQLGIYNKDLFRLKNLSWRVEWNGVRPYTYGHGFGKNGLNYTHNNQTLTDPFNANFNEFISILQCHNNRWYGILENLFTIRGESPAVPLFMQLYNNGENPWGGETGVPVYGSKTMQGVHHKYLYNQLSVGYLINPKNGLAFQADIIYRKHTAPGIYGMPGISQSNLFLTVGIVTRLFNYYHDF